MSSSVASGAQNFIEVSHPELMRNESHTGGWRLRYSITKRGSLVSELLPRNYFEIEFFGINGEIPDLTKVPESILMVPAFNFFFPLTLLLPVELRMGEIDKDALKSVDAFRRAIAKVYGVDQASLGLGGLRIGEVVKNESRMASDKRLVMYSGGVDSYANVAHNYKHIILGSVEGLEATRGRDRNKTEPAMVFKRQEMARLANALNAEAVVIKVFPYKYINKAKIELIMRELRLFSGSGGYDFVSDTILHTPLISMFAPYAWLRGVDISIGSTYEPVNAYQLKNHLSIEKDCGNPEFSDALKFCGHRFTEQDGLYQTRTEKIKDIIAFSGKSGISVNPIVCFSEDGSNCHECKKCIRTQLNFLVLDENPISWGFEKFSPEYLMESIDKLNYFATDSGFSYDILHHVKPSGEYRLMNDFLREAKACYGAGVSGGLVSVLTPVFNGGRYIKKLLDSVLIQTYPDVEMVIIDDGSTDDTADIVKAYIPLFAARGFSLRYVWQENQGQSVAVNNGLKYVRGDYLVWPDADDYYASSTTLAQMVYTLSRSDNDTSMVRSYYNLLNVDEEKIGTLDESDATRYKDDLFEDCLFEYGKSFWTVTGGYMAKMSKVDECIPGREIYTEKGAGQNYQLALPLLYQHKCVTIREYLYNLVVHEDSHSRDLKTGNERQYIYNRTIKATLDTISLDREYKEYLIRRVDEMTESNMVKPAQRLYRTYIKRLVKGILPHGLIVLYRRRK